METWAGSYKRISSVFTEYLKKNKLNKQVSTQVLFGDKHVIITKQLNN